MRAALGLACAPFLGVQMVTAQTLIWDGGGANASWSTTANWSTNVAPVVTAGSTQVLEFAGTIRPASTMSNSYSVGSLTFESGSAAFTLSLGTKTLTVDGSAPEISDVAANLETLSSGTIAFSSAGVINVGSGDTLAISSKLSGSSALSVQGGGILELTGASTAYSGALTVAAGTLQVSTSNSTLGTGTTTVDSGATLSITDNRSLTNSMTLSGTGVGGAGAIETSGTGTATLSGPLTLAANTTINATAGTLKLSGGFAGSGYNLTLIGAGSYTLSGAITTGSGGVTLSGTGTTTLSGANTYTGLTTVNSGTLDLSSALHGNLTLTGGTAVDENSTQLLSTSSLTLNGGTFNLNGKTESIGSLAGSSGGTAILALGAGTLSDSQSTTTSFDGSLTGSGTLKMQGTGVLGLTGSSSTFTGAVAVTSGTVNAGATNATGTSTSTVTVSGTGNLQVQGGATLASKFNVTGTGGSGNGAIENVSGNNTLTGAVTASGASRIQSDSGTLTLSGATSLSGYSLNVGGTGNTTITGAITATSASSLTKDGSGTLAIGVANPSFAGSVAINAGTLQANVANVFLTSTAVTFASGSTLSLNGTSQAIGTLNGAGTVAFGSGGALALSSGSGADLLSGAFTGSGTLTISTGSTLTLGANFSDASLNIVLAGGTLKFNGTTDTFGSLTVTSNSVIDFANPSTSILTVSSVSLSGTSQLSVTNWANTVDYFYSLASPGTQGTAPIDQIVFSGFAGSQTHWTPYASGPLLENEISPVPEVPRYGALLVGAALVGVMALRRRMAS